MILSDGKTDPGTTDQSGSTDYNRQYLQLHLHPFCYFQDIHFSFSFYYIYEFSYKFDTVFFYQFLETGTSDITFMGRNQELKRVAFSLYPLLFFLYSPFKEGK